MRLNELSPAPGSRSNRKRVGRGIGSGWGKTCGTGHKGQKSRSGGTVKPGFEGGQMPIQRRLPKFGFTSQKSLYTTEVRTSELNKLTGDVTLEALKAANLVRRNMLDAKIVLSGEIKSSVNIKGLRVTKGAKSAIEAAGGSVE